jgi:hydroxypyruvate isomerase
MTSRSSSETTHSNPNPITRREVLGGASGIAAAALLGDALPRAASGADTRQVKGRIKQSLVHWCYSKYFDVEKMCQVAGGLGCRSIELIAVEHWPTLKKHGLSCAIASSHGFVQGMNNPKYHEKTLDLLRKQIDHCADAGVPSVITFTGMCEDIARDAGMDNCVNGYKKIVGYAEEKKVNLCLEMLNSRVNEYMKGHPGYMGDHTDWCIELIKKVGSERMKLLFDIYHVQIMDGDVIARIRQHKDYIGHVHTAGNPGRGELDDKQEINYKPIMQALIDVGYQGYVGQEFIPTRDPEQGLSEAVALCDV